MFFSFSYFNTATASRCRVNWQRVRQNPCNTSRNLKHFIFVHTILRQEENVKFVAQLRTPRVRVNVTFFSKFQVAKCYGGLAELAKNSQRHAHVEMSSSANFIVFFNLFFILVRFVWSARSKTPET